MISRICAFVVISLAVRSAYSANTKMRDQTIVYPGPSVLPTRSGVDTVSVPKECMNQTYCTVKPNDYPEEKFNQMFKGYKTIPPPKLVINDLDLDHRQGDPDDIDNCPSTITFEPLYKVQSEETNEWRTVIQAPKENFVQRVRLETCKNAGKKCFNIFPDMPQVKTFCKQKYNTWEVLVAEGDGNKMIKAKLPVCCSCHYSNSRTVAFGPTN